ncbi:iron-containing alcohol dehydrogenase family protein [Brevibacillus sp. SYSU BS000544]|uniref:iron-containing alcohol dehydrogenase family protein n=1 Tax=Brevibacillus sp. SYSU BS000544 TaxID=3416443 RepID=UPI003CE5146D
MERLEVRGAPNTYVCEEGILDELESLLQKHGITRPLVVHGERSWNAASLYFLKNTTEIFTFERYKGECTEAEVQRIVSLIDAGEYDAVIGVGGGKVLDIAKAAGNGARVDIVLIPTLASTCAAWTPLSVFYNEEGHFTHYTMFAKGADLVLVEPRILLEAPVRYLIAGIADTLAKWYEADVLIEKVKNRPVVLDISYHAAKLCQQILLQQGREAVEDYKRKQVTHSLVSVFETIFVAGGMVGGYGDKYGRISGAHAIHNGLTVASATHEFLHGEKVAYGILVQLAIEQKWDAIDELLPYYLDLGLPTRLESVGLHLEDSTTLRAVCERTVLPYESIHLMGEITAEQVFLAIQELERVSGV